ncbi:hypothetical protein C5N14_23680 [Micromonospora sp. MW-13]|uniref:hypothetical protein n=1 Tax=unclassified Micromonospora TaxID=2617518 RepID=UPI000E445740|nr:MULTISPECIES: hypothetical protein [unclassified Micromonospora]MCX4470422.1 hypothetical protein [Micromonospora sp. NBC_01655]RGC66401.1 hypothetical protein C5N14_23680 [Micromonospora sp. MW-13]
MEPTSRAVLAYFVFVAAGYLRFGVATAAARRSRRKARWFKLAAVAMLLVGVGLLGSILRW